jgi:hypothetical protein
MAHYSKFPEMAPTEGVNLWVDRNSYIGEPFLAQYSSALKGFTSVDNSIFYPAYFIVRWRYA